jgi:uncharacterized delta-60 repeat protein
MDDDRLVVTGATFDGVGDPDWAILRLTADGMPDVSFGTNGVVQLDLGGYDSPPAPIVDDQDRVVVGGMSESDVVLGRLTAGGQWDDSFGMANGRTRLTFPDDFDYGATLLQQSTGRWVVAGTQDGTDADIALAGFNADGTVDTTFGSGGTGRRITDIGGSGDHDEIEDAMLLPDDSIVVAGEHDPAGPSQMLVAKYSSNGTLANGSFGGATGTGPGYATFLRDPGGSKAEGVLAQPDGRLVLGITDDSTGTGDFGAIRVLANGVADSTFTGDVGLGSGSSDMDTMIWSFDGKPLLIGDSGSDLAIFRLDVPRILDYLSPSSTWSAGANSFGACLRAVSNGATTDVSTWTPTGSCTASDADPWHGIPTQASASEAKIAAAPSGDLDARAHLRFGIRTANSQAPTGYWAPMTFVVLAPDA